MITKKNLFSVILSCIMTVCILNGVLFAKPASANEVLPAVINPIAKYEFKDATDLGKDSMGNYHMEYRNKWVSGSTGELLNVYTSVDEVNGGVTFDGQFCLSQDKDSNMFADVSAFTLCFEIMTAKGRGEWEQYIGIGNSADVFAFIGRATNYPGQLRLHTFNMLEWEGVSSVYNAPKIFDFGENNAPTEYQKIVVSVQPGGDMLVYLNGELVALKNSNKNNQAWDTSIDETWATATKNSFFAIGGRYNGAVDRMSSGSIRNVQFYDFAMDATCVSAYNTNGQLTTADTVNLPTVTGLEEVVFDGEPTNVILNAGMSDQEMLSALNSANAKFVLSNGSFVSTPITWVGIERDGQDCYAKGSISSTKLGYVNTFGTEITYKLSVVEFKSLGEPIFAGEVLKGEIKDTMSKQEMLSLVNGATVVVTFMDDSTQTVDVTFSDIKSSMGNYKAIAKVMINDVLYGTVSVAIQVTETNEGPMAELKPIALWTFDNEETKLEDSMGKYEFQSVKIPASADYWGLGTVTDGVLYLDGQSMMALPVLNDVSENITNGFTLNFQYKQDGLYETAQGWSAPVSFGAKDFGSSFGAGFIISDNSGDLRVQGYDITKNIVNGETSMYWTQKVVESGENAWHNVTLSVRPGETFDCYVDGELKYTAECPADWSLEHDETAFSIGGRLLWSQGYNLFKGWIDNVSIYNFAQDLEQSNAYWSKAKLVVQDMNGEIITDVSNQPTFENGIPLSSAIMDNMYDAQVKRRINPATVDALFDNDQTTPLNIEWLGYKRENGVWYIYGQVDTQNLGYATTLTGKVEVKVQVEVTPAPRLITVGTAKNGTVTTDKTQAYLDEEIVITPTPSKGYIVGLVKVNGIAISANDDGEYVYKVTGADDIEVTATFKVDPNANKTEPSEKGCKSNILGQTFIVSLIGLSAVTWYFVRRKHN